MPVSNTTVQGTIANSAGTALSGELTVTLSGVMPHNTSVLLLKQEVFTITAGVVDISLPPTDTTGQTYHFVFETISGETRTTWLDFYAEVPTSASPVELTSLLPTPVVKDTMDTSLRRLADLLSSDPVKAAILRLKLTGRGEWDSEELYGQGDVVTVAGTSYVYFGLTLTSGLDPTTHPEVWQLLAAKGETGAGTAGNTAPFGVDWNGQTDAPSRGAVYNEFLNRATTTALALKADIDDPTFTGVPKAPTPTNTTNTTQLATTAWVWGLLSGAGLLSTAAPTEPTAPTLGATDNSTRVATTAHVKSYASHCNPLTGHHGVDLVITATGKRVRIFGGSQDITQSWAGATTYSFTTSPITGSWTLASAVLSHQCNAVNLQDYTVYPTGWTTGNTLNFSVRRGAAGTLTILVRVYYVVILTEN